MSSPRLRILLVVAALTAGACGGGSDDDDATPETTAATTAGAPPSAPGGPPTQDQLDRLNVQWTHIATAEYPTVVTHRQGALYVGEREGTVRAIKDGKPVDPPALDITDEVGTAGEGGFLGLAFSPDGATMYVSYTDNKTDSRVAAYTMNGDRADPGSRRELLFLDQPAVVHNGGNLVVDGKGLLLASFGDGGVRTPAGRQAAQDLGSMFGSIVRIDPTPSGGKPYTVPADNPYVGRAGALPEIYAYGLRNPWRFSLDRATGDLWVGDVGEANAEEVDFLPASAKGANFGWPAFEGAVRFTGAPPADHVPPLKSITRSSKFCAVTGGYVYRGKAIPDLVGTYVYADLCTGNVRLLSQKDGKVVAERPLGVLLDQLVSFGEDAEGELYAMSLVGQIWKLMPG